MGYATVIPDTVIRDKKKAESGHIPQQERDHVKKTLIGAAAVALGVTGALAFVTAAQAAETCKTVTVENRVGPDSGENGNNWATNTIDRTLKVCTNGGADEDKLWTYTATVTDSGEFVTLAGDSPGVGTVAKLVGGVHGTVNGGFTATFLAQNNWAGLESLESPPTETTTGMWVETAFPGAQFTAAGSVADWRWVYNLCGENGEWWVNAETGSTGDITEKACPTESPSPSPSASESESPSPTPSASESASPSPSNSVSPSASVSPSQSTTAAPVPTDTESTESQNAGLPVTGPSGGTNVPLIGALAGTALLAIGAALFVWARRRNTVAFTA